MKRLIFILSFFAALFPFTAHAASTAPYVPLSVPTSPQAAAFKMYGDVAVNPAMGVPDISIPLFDIDHHGYRLPLSLKYNPAPFHPGYNYDVFGRGWALSISSCISRSIECMPDELTDFKLDTDKFGESYRNLSEEYLNTLELKSDLFTAILPDGSSFEFVIRKTYDGKIEYVVSGGRDVKITHATRDRKIISFKVVDEQDVEYAFTGADTTFRGTGCTITPYNTTYVSWQLTSIRLPHSSELITFDYGKSIHSNFGYQQAEPAVRFHHFYELGCSPDVFDVTVHTYTRQHAYQMKLLTSVTYGTTTIRINYKDGTNSEYYNYAQSISIKDGDRLVRTINLEQHQGTLQSSSLSKSPFSMLDSVTLLGGNDASSETYRCGYTSSYANFGGTDHWGNLNFRSNNYDVAYMNLFVGFDVSRASSSFVTDVPKDENDLSPLDKVRLSNVPYNTRKPAGPESHCVLRKLTYPTGGYTEFEFENHEFFSFTDDDGDYIHDKKRRVKTKATGFRIREIVNYTAEGVRSDSKHYCYGKTEYEEYGWEIGRYYHTGAGEPTLDPTIQTYMNYQSTDLPMSVLNMVLGLDPNGQYRSFKSNPFMSYSPSGGYPVYTWEWECTFSAFNFQRLLNGRPAVVYPEVTVYYLKDGATQFSPENCNGKTVYQYDIYEAMQNDTAFFEKPQYYGNVLWYEGEKYRYNLLKEQTDYMSDGREYKLKRRESLIWRYGGSSVIDWEYSNSYGTPYFVPINAVLGSFYTSTCQMLGHSLLYERKVTTYDESETGVTDTEHYSYLSGNRMQWKERNAGGLHRETNWEYPAIAQTGTTPDIVRKMVEKHILNPVLKEIQNQNSYNYEGNRREFGEFPTESGDTLILPARFYQTINDSSSHYSEVLAYSSNGNPREVVSKDKLHTVYLWGYGDRYLIAEIKNATLEQVETAVSSVFGMTSSALAKSTTPDVAKLKALRNHTSLSEAHVTTFTHLPLVGVTSISDPTGKTSYYDYDGLGRLKANYYYEGNVVEESKKRVVQEYDYHYRN